jgi:hypothetical protein
LATAPQDAEAGQCPLYDSPVYWGVVILKADGGIRTMIMVYMIDAMTDVSIESGSKDEMAFSR